MNNPKTLTPRDRFEAVAFLAALAWLAVIALLIIGAGARAQSKPAAAFDADAREVLGKERVAVSVTGVRFACLSDGGCTGQPEVQVDGVPVQSAVRFPRAAVCRAACDLAQAAARLDVGVTDGGAP